MKTATGRGLLILVTFSLVVSIFASAGSIGYVQASGPTYSTHSAIRINNNSDLATLKSSGGCTGSGTITDPYVIKGYDITGTGGTCIYIGNTTRYLVVSDCLLHGNNAGIELIGAVHVTVSNNICSGNTNYGIHTSAASLSIIENNTLTGAGLDDMFFQDSNNNIIQNNTSTGSGHCSNWLSNSNNNIFSNNTSTGSYGGCGLQIQGSDGNIVSNNTLMGNAQHGIRLFDSSDRNTVTHNICRNNSYTGISLSPANNNSVTYNICYGNTQYGIIQTTSSGNVIYANELINNNGASSTYVWSHTQAYNDRMGLWNSSSYGNFWSDWTAPDANRDGIVDNPYPVYGGVGAKDHLPTTSCPGLYLELVAPSQAMKGDNVSWSFLVRNDGRMTIQNLVVKDPILSKTWTLGDLASGKSLQWSYSGVITMSENIINIAYATGTDAFGGPYNTSDSHTISVISPPSSPQDLTVTVEDGRAILNWIAPSSTGQAMITDYRVFRGISSSGESYLGHTGSGSTLTFTDSGLIRGQTYYYQVSAVNSAGEGPRSSERIASPFGSPTEPLNLQATPGNNQVTLTWSAPSSNGGSNVDLYVVYQNGVIVQQVTSTSVTITELTNGQLYSFKVAGHNSVGIGMPSSTVTATPSLAPTVPGAPMDLVVTPGYAQASLSWTAPTNNGGASIDYYVVYQDGIDISHPIATSIIITGLTNGQPYRFAVAAHNAVGIGARTTEALASPSSTAEIPGTPRDLIVTLGDGQVKLSWTPPTDGSGIDYYIVYQNGVDVVHPSGNSTTITGLTNGQDYSFAVAAHNTYGVGTLSSSQTATPSAATDDASSSSPGNDNMGIYLGVLAILVAAMVATIFVLRRGKK